VVGIGVGQHDADDRGTPRSRHLEQSFGRRIGRIAWIDDDDLPPADHVRIDGLARHAARARQDDASDARRLLDDADRLQQPWSQPLADLVERADVLELLEGCARRHPQAHPARGTLIEGRPRRQPPISDHFSAHE
jgi:hypothetical protein